MLLLRFLAFVGLVTGSTPTLFARDFSPDDAVNVLHGSDLEQARQPQVAVSPQGEVAIAFGEGTEIYCVTARADENSTAAGAQALRFNPPVRLGTLPKLALGLRRGPRVVWTKDALVVTAISHDNGNVWSWRSADRGQHWEGPLKVNDTDRTALEGLHAMAAGPAGLIYCVWLDLRSGKNEVYGAASRDGGASWSENQLVYHSPSGTVCECCHPSVAIDSDERIVVLFRNSLDGNRDMYLIQSQDDGESFSRATRLGIAAWQLKACPMDGGAVAVTPQGEVVTAWRRKNEVFRTAAGFGEQLLGHGEQPWIAATESGVYVAWLNSRGSALRFLSPTQPQPIVLATSAADPVLACAPGGKSPVVAAWESEVDGQRVIMAKVVEGRN